jgi:hypothetical protein
MNIVLSGDRQVLWQIHDSDTHLRIVGQAALRPAAGVATNIQYLFHGCRKHHR